MIPHHVTLAEALLRLSIAFALGLPLGWTGERQARSAGLRTYPLLSACACGILLLPQGAAWDVGQQADVFYGLLTGIGFVGSGAVLKTRRRARGMGTAVSLWLTGAVGAGVACGAWQVAVVIAALTLVALRAPALSDRGLS